MPKAVATPSESCGTTVKLAPKGEIFVNQKKGNEESLERALQDVLNNNSNRTVVLRGDKDVLLGKTVKVMSLETSDL